MTALTCSFCLLTAVAADQDDAKRLVARTTIGPALVVRAYLHDPPSGEVRVPDIKIISVAVTDGADNTRVVWGRQEPNVLVHDFATGKTFPDPWNFKHYRFYPLDREHVIFSYVSYGGIKVFKVDLKNSVDLLKVWEEFWSFPGESWMNNVYHIPMQHMLREAHPELLFSMKTVPKITAATFKDGIWRVTVDWNGHIVSFIRPDDGPKWKLEEVRRRKTGDRNGDAASCWDRNGDAASC